MMREHRRRERETKPGRRRSGVLLTLAGLLAVLALGGVPLLAQKGLGGGQKPAAPSRLGVERKPGLAAKACIECHGEVRSQRSRKVVHEPFRNDKGCESCHRRHGIVGTLALQQEEPALCYSCHAPSEKAFQQAHVHAPVGEGNCSSCHAAHASDNPGLLRRPEVETCLACHDAAAFQKPGTHPPAREACGACHDPHATPTAGLLRQLDAPTSAAASRAAVQGYTDESSARAYLAALGFREFQ